MATDQRDDSTPETTVKIADDYRSLYCNAVSIIASPRDFQFFICDITRDMGEIDGRDVREVKTRIVMSPQQAFQFNRALEGALEDWIKNNVQAVEDSDGGVDEEEGDK